MPLRIGSRICVTVWRKSLSIDYSGLPLGTFVSVYLWMRWPVCPIFTRLQPFVCRRCRSRLALTLLPITFFLLPLALITANPLCLFPKGSQDAFKNITAMQFSTLYFLMNVTLVHSTGLAIESHAGENIFQVGPKAGSAS